MLAKILFKAKASGHAFTHTYILAYTDTDTHIQHVYPHPNFKSNFYRAIMD